MDPFESLTADLDSGPGPFDHLTADLDGSDANETPEQKAARLRRLAAAGLTPASSPSPTPAPDAASTPSRLSLADAADATRVGAPPRATPATDLNKGNLPERVLGAVTGMAEHPLDTAVGVATALPKAAFDVGRYIGQPIARAIEPEGVQAMIDQGTPEVTGRQAAISAAQLATAAVPAAAEALGGALSPLKAAAARLALHGAAGAAFTPSDPAVGATIGATIGAVAPHGANAANEAEAPEISPAAQESIARYRATQAAPEAAPPAPVKIPASFGGGEMAPDPRALAEKLRRMSYDPFGDAGALDRFNTAAPEPLGPRRISPAPPPSFPSPVAEPPAPGVAVTRPTPTAIESVPPAGGVIKHDATSVDALSQTYPRGSPLSDLLNEVSLRMEHHGVTSGEALEGVEEDDHARDNAYTPDDFDQARSALSKPMDAFDPLAEALRRETATARQNLASAPPNMRGYHEDVLRTLDPANIKAGYTQARSLATRLATNPNDAEARAGLDHILRNTDGVGKQFIQAGIDDANMLHRAAVPVDAQKALPAAAPSKVVDEQGQPLRMFHGTGEPFTDFKAGGARPVRPGLHGEGIWFTSNPEKASEYASLSGGDAPNVHAVHLDIRNPASLSQEEMAHNSIADLRARGYDGVRDLSTGHWVAFSNDQIRPAIGDVEYRHAGVGLTPEQKKAVGTSVSQSLSDVYAPIREEAPDLHAALHAAGATPPISARRFVAGMTDLAHADLNPNQVDLFGKRIAVDNLEAIARQRAADAAEAAKETPPAEHAAEAPKSSRGLWYSRTTAGGALRDPKEMETAPLLDEMGRRIQASKLYHRDMKKYGPMSVVTIRNEQALHNIADILTNRDNLDSDQVWSEAERRGEEQRRGEPVDEESALDFPVHEPPSVTPEDATVRAEMLQQASARATAHAKAIEATLPGGDRSYVDRQPWFTKALEKTKRNVGDFGEAAAVGAGVKPESLRQPSKGLYMRMVPVDRYNAQVLRSNAETEARSPGSTNPRGAGATRVLGRRSGAPETFGEPTDRAIGMAASDVREKPAMRNFPPGTAKTASAKMATASAQHYITDFKTTAMYDAADKASKAQRNAVYQQVQKLGNELTPDRRAPVGRRVLSFNDLNQMVDAPPEGSEIPPGFRRFSVSPEVADAVQRFDRYQRGSTAVANRWRRGVAGVTKSVLLNPAVAYGHGLTLAGNVGAGIPADAGAASAIASGLPIAKVASTLKRFHDVDFEDPATIQRAHRLALSGALRISAEDQGGWVNRGHNVLFGTTGIDVRARLVASEDFESAMRKEGITPKDPAYTALERDYVTNHAGNYVARNTGALTQWLQDSGIAPFIAINRAKYGTAFRGLIGRTGTPEPSARARLATIMRGPAGTVAAITGAGYLLSGHRASQNAPGHETDMATGVYHLPGPDGQYHATDLSSYRYFRGDPADAQKQFGSKAREVYFRKGFVDPTTAAAARILEPLAYADKGAHVSDLLRASANAGLALVGPLPAMVWTGATGKEAYFDRDGTLGDVQGLHLEPDAGLVDRLRAVARDANAGLAAGVPPSGSDRPSGVGALLGNLAPAAEGNPGSRAGSERHRAEAWMEAATKEIAAEKDPAKSGALVLERYNEALDHGYTGPAVLRQLQSAQRRSQRGSESETAARLRAAAKFQRQILGSGGK